MTDAFECVAKFSTEQGVPLRTAAYACALKEIDDAMSACGTEGYFSKPAKEGHQ